MHKFQAQIWDCRSQLKISKGLKNLIVIKHHLTYIRTGVPHHHELRAIDTFPCLYLAEEDLAKVMNRRGVYLVVQDLENPRLQLLDLIAWDLKMPYLFIYRLYFYGVDLIQLRGNENTHNPDLVQLIQLQILLAVTVV